MKRIQPIVEGDGDARALPLLLRNILTAHNIFDHKILPPQRRGEYPTVDKSFENFFQAATKEKAPILWVMDFDSKQYTCPVHESQKLIKRANTLRPGWPIQIAFLVKEYEALFLADKNATRSIFPDISDKVVFPEKPEEIRDAKGWLSQQRPIGKAYKETVHQEKITAHLNFDILRERSRDFAHLERATLALVNAAIPD